MNIISKKYKKKFSILLLSGFLAFSVLCVLHSHKYNFSNEYSLNQTSSSPLHSSDFNNGLFSYCNLHQFSQSILKYDNTKINNRNISDLGIGIITNNIGSNYSFSKSNLIPRAPPFSI